MRYVRFTSRGKHPDRVVRTVRRLLLAAVSTLIVGCPQPMPPAPTETVGLELVAEGVDELLLLLRHFPVGQGHHHHVSQVCFGAVVHSAIPEEAKRLGSTPSYATRSRVGSFPWGPRREEA